jgi:hypothetical protein
MVPVDCWNTVLAAAHGNATPMGYQFTPSSEPWSWHPPADTPAEVTATTV